MTTIPPRFTSIHHTLASWLQQEDYQPACILILVPRVYRRFKQRSHNETATEMVTTASLLESSIREQAPALAEHLDSGRVRIVPVDADLGPITKLTGLLQHRATACTPHLVHRPIDFWVFGDDDVAYTPQTLRRYDLRMLLPPPGLSPASLSRTALTHFSEDARMVVQLSPQENPQRVRHVQGVDTVLLPTALLDLQIAQRRALHPTVCVQLLELAIFPACPDAFFQDDYVISLLLHLAGIDVVSAWNNDHVAKHVKDVSKSNSQLHMKANVYEREEATKACLTREAADIYSLSKKLAASGGGLGLGLKLAASGGGEL